MSSQIRQVFLFCFVLFFNVAASAQSLTATTVSVSPGSGFSGSVFSLTAHVTSNGVPLTSGTVTFTATYGSGQSTVTLGSAQVQSANGVAGTAVLHKAIGGIGQHTIVATFSAIANYSGSISASQTINISPFYSTATEINQPSGTAGNYTLSATLSAFGSAPPNGTMIFTNTTSRIQVASLSLDPSSSVSQLTPLPVTPVPNIALSGPTIGDFNNDGYQDLVAPTTLGSVDILLGSSNGALTPKSSLAIDSPVSTISGDFNNDGNLDLVVLGQDPSAQISIFLGNGDGTFQSPSILAPAALGTSQYAMIAVGDFNNDGNLDLVASDQKTNAIIVLTGNGNGSFGAPATITVGDVFNIVVGDLDHDGNQDLVIADDGAADIVILYGAGDGTFGPKTLVPLPPSAGQSSSVMIGDFNNDGNLDIAANDQSGGGSIYVLMGDGDRNFASANAYANNQNPYFLTVGDFNQDGKIDIITADIGPFFDDYDHGSVGVLLNNGDGTFSGPVYYPVGGQATFALVGDLNGDNQVDIAAVVTNLNPGGISGLSILLSGQTNTVQATPITVHGCGPQTITASYLGDSNYASSVSSSSITLTPSIDTATLFEAVTPTPVYGQQVQLIATLSPFADGSASTNGELITFKDGSQVLGTAPLITGVATLPWAFTTVGNHSLNAVYAGGCVFQATDAPVIAAVVSKATVTLTAATNAAIIALGQTVKFTATVQPSGTGQPTGTVTFYSNGQAIGTSAVTNGTATFSTSGLSANINNITATYSGDMNFLSGSSTNSISVTIGGFDFTIKVMSPDQTTGQYGDSLQYTFLVSRTDASTLPGIVQFSATTLPTLNAAFIFSPSSISLNSAPGTVSLSAKTSLADVSNSLAQNKKTPLLPRLAPIAACFLLPLVMVRRHRNVRHMLTRFGSVILLILLSLGGAISLSGCGSGLAPYDYPIVVTATSGNVSHTVTVTFHVNGTK